jgi:hypothetical protein
MKNGFELTGFDEFSKKLEEMGKKAEENSRETVDCNKLYKSRFMQDNTKFNTF